jgi:uncharacterized OB-fold protein
VTERPVGRPLPDLDDELTAPFWAGLRDRRVRAQQCQGCDRFRWPPLPICPHCASRVSEWVDLPRQGVLWSFATYHRAFHPAFAAEIPYTVGLVDVVAGVRHTGRLLGPREEFEVGHEMAAVFEDVSPDVTLLHWRRV